MPYRGVAPSFIYKIDHRFPKTGDFKSSGRKYTLESEITKLIVYSNCETKLNIVLWRMSPEEEIIKTTEAWEIKPEMNVICLCRFRMTEEWADEYFRIQTEVHRDTDMLSLQVTPELHRRWQMFRLADSYPLLLAETVAIALGVKMLRQGDAVKQARRESVNHAMTTNAELMQKMELSQAQKILLRFNVDMKNSCYCYKMTYRTNGHGNVALGPNLAMDRVWDLQYVEEMGDYFPWIQGQWRSMCEDTYWDNDGDDHPEYDFDSGICAPYISKDND